jgi:hypothetical protein
MKKRMRRIWEDIWKRFPEKIKRLRKNKKQSSTSLNKISPNESNVEMEKKSKVKEANMNEGYKKDEVHPFSIPE